MAKIKYFATLPNGEEVTRTSARTYTHVVIGVETRANREDRSRADLAELQRQLDKMTAPGYVEQVRADFAKNFGQEVGDETAAKVPGWIEGTQSRMCKVVEAIANDSNDDRFIVFGWAGRPDLAEKEAARAGKHARVTHVFILEAQTR